MPGQVVKLRLKSWVDVNREYRSDLVVHILGIVNEIALVIACFFFFEFMPMPIYNAGIWIFIIACGIGFGVSAYRMWEYMFARSRYGSELRHEMFELTMYMICHLTYVVGSVLFLPQLYKTQSAMLVGHAVSSWFWIWGSLALVVAGHWNCIGFIEATTKLQPSSRTTLLRRLASVALSCSAVGGSLFLTGSFLFRPGLRNDCESPEAFRPVPVPRGKTRYASSSVRQSRSVHRLLRPEAFEELAKDATIEVNPFCVSIIEQGTLLFALGAITFLAHAILSLLCAMILRRIRLQEVVEGDISFPKRRPDLQAIQSGPGIRRTQSAD